MLDVLKVIGCIAAYLAFILIVCRCIGFDKQGRK